MPAMSARLTGIRENLSTDKNSHSFHHLKNLEDCRALCSEYFVFHRRHRLHSIPAQNRGGLHIHIDIDIDIHIHIHTQVNLSMAI